MFAWQLPRCYSDSLSVGPMMWKVNSQFMEYATRIGWDSPVDKWTTFTLMGNLDKHKNKFNSTQFFLSSDPWAPPNVLFCVTLQNGYSLWIYWDLCQFSDQWLLIHAPFSRFWYSMWTFCDFVIHKVLHMFVVGTFLLLCVLKELGHNFLTESVIFIRYLLMTL